MESGFAYQRKKIKYEIETEKSISQYSMETLAKMYVTETLDGNRMHPIDGILSFVTSCHIDNKLKINILNSVMMYYYAMISAATIQKIAGDEILSTDNNKPKLDYIKATKLINCSAQAIAKHTNGRIAINSVYCNRDNEVVVFIQLKNYTYESDNNNSVRVHRSKNNEIINKVYTINAKVGATTTEIAFEICKQILGHNLVF